MQSAKAALARTGQTGPAVFRTGGERGGQAGVQRDVYKRQVGQSRQDLWSPRRGGGGIKGKAKKEKWYHFFLRRKVSFKVIRLRTEINHETRDVFFFGPLKYCSERLHYRCILEKRYSPVNPILKGHVVAGTMFDRF